MKLISMTDFVLGQDTDQPSARRLSQIIGYAEFLKQPLKLEMFVPCNDNGTVLEPPIYTTNHSDECYCKGCEEETKRCSDLQDQYRKVKEKVLFSFPGGVHYLTDGLMDVNLINSIDTVTLFHYSEDLGYWKLTPFWEDKLIEDLIGLNIELTENAIKTIKG